MDIKKFFQSKQGENSNEMQDEPARKCPKLDDTKILACTDDEYSEAIDEEEPFDNDREEESEDILGEPTAPIS